MEDENESEAVWRGPMPFTLEQQRHMALDFAIRVGGDPSGVLERAQKYLDFLTGKAAA